MLTFAITFARGRESRLAIAESLHRSARGKDGKEQTGDAHND